MSNDLDVSIQLNAQQRGLNEIQSDMARLVQQFHAANQALGQVSSSSQLNAENMQLMADHGVKAVKKLETELSAARLELNRLSATNATPADINNARARVELLTQAVNSTRISVNAYAEAAKSAARQNPVPTALQREVGQLVNNLESVGRTLDQNGNSATHSKKQLEAMSRSATAQLQRYSTQLQNAKLELNRLSATSASPRDIEKARQNVAQLEQSVNHVSQALSGYQQRARIANQTLQSESNKSRSAVSGLSSGIINVQSALTTLATAIGATIGVKELVKLTDSYASLSTRIKLTTGETGNFEQAMSGVQRLAIETNSSLDSTAQLFTKINDVGKTLGLTQQQTLDLTKTINKAVQVGGGSAQATEAAIVQLTQSFSAGILRGEEYNSVVEQTPRLAKALADGLGVTQGELRKMAGEGKLAASKVMSALQSQSKVLQEEFDKFPTTIGNALQRISTQWQILIGEFDQANGASKNVSASLVFIADNLNIVKGFLNDLGDGWVWVGSQLKKIDTSTLEAFKTVVENIYDACKSLISAGGELIVDVFDVLESTLTNALSILSAFTGGVQQGEEKVSFFTRVLQGLSVGVGVLADGFAGLKIAFELITGVLFTLSAAANQTLSSLSWGDISKQFAASADEMQKKADSYYAKANKDALEFKSQIVKNINDAAKTQQQKDAESAQSSKEKFDKINQQSDENLAKLKANLDEQIRLQKEADQGGKSNSALEHLQQSKEALEQLEKSSAERRKALNQQIVDAQKDGDLTALSSAKSSLSQIDAEHQKLTGQVKQYQAEVGQNVQYTGQMSIDANAKKIEELQKQEQELRNKQKSFTADGLDEAKAYAEARIKANNGVMDGTMQADLMSKGYIVTLNEQGKVSVEAWVKDEQGAKNAKLALENLKQAKEALESFDKESASRRASLSQQVATAQQNGDLTAVASAQDAISQIDAKHAELANKIKQRQAELDQGSQNSSDVAKNAAKAAAESLGLNFDVALNRVSQGFSMGESSLAEFTKNLQGMGVTGEQAANVTYQAWQKWLESAKSEAEIELAKKKLKEFEKDGVFSISQVEAGMTALHVTTQKLPNALTAVEQAFERLGIKTKQQLKDAAEIAIADFKTISASGQATQEQLKQAAERTMQAAQASGNASVQALAKAQASIAGLNVEVDKSGKVAVQSTQDWFDSLDKVHGAAKNAGSSMSSIGDSAEDAADRTASAFEKAGESISSSLSKAKSGMTEVKGRLWTTAQEIEEKLKSKGYTDEEAKHYAEKIYNDSKGSAFGGAAHASDAYYKRKLGNSDTGADRVGRGASSNFAYVDEQLEKYESLANDRKRREAINKVAEETPNRITETKRIQLMAGNDHVEFDIHQSQENSLDVMLNQLAMAKKRY